MPEEQSFIPHNELGEQITEYSYETDPEIRALLEELSTIKSEAIDIQRSRRLSGKSAEIGNSEIEKLNERETQIQQAINHICEEKKYIRNPRFDLEIVHA